MKYVLGTLNYLTFKEEDGGQAKISEDIGDDRLFVRIHSWRDAVNNPNQFRGSGDILISPHVEFDTLIGKKVTVTIEVEE